MNTTPYSTTQYEINQFGFPVEECSRCDGSGQYSYCQRYGTTCFKCSGTGKQIIKKAQKAYIEFTAYVRSRKNCMAQDLSVDEMISHDGKWWTLTAIGITPRVTMWTGAERTPYGYEMHLTLSNGEVVHASTNSVIRRNTGTLDPTPFLCMIPKDRQPKK
jgi:hypothetical protein